MFIALLILYVIYIITIGHHIMKYNSPEITFEKFLLMQILNFITTLVFFMVWLKILPTVALIVSYSCYSLFILIFSIILKRGD